MLGFALKPIRSAGLRLSSLILAVTTLAATLAAGACAAQPQKAAGPAQSQTTGRMLAQSSCPVRISDAEAWVDYMPGPGRSPKEVHVAARLEKPGETAMLLRSPLTTREALYVEVRATASSARPGMMDYREEAPDPLFKRVVFLCRGGEIYSIEALKTIY
jgi:hypothetical protein